MFALMGMHYQWASPDYLMEMPWFLLLTYWDELNAILGGAGKDSKIKVPGGDSPDRDRFYALYSDKIKRG
jgi:hypothetical protein